MPAYHFEIMFCGNLGHVIMNQCLFQTVSKRMMQLFKNALAGALRMSFCTERGSKILDLIGS
jgi:hypothetical protein